jgi:hypothetical protein
MKKTQRRFVAGMLAAAALSTLQLSAPLPLAFAHKADCPVCDMAIVEKEEVRMKVGNNTHDYRCVLCAIAEAKGEYPKSDVTISAPSEKSTRITVKRVKGKWSASPASAVFLKAGKHRTCHLGYHAFTSKSALAAWAKKNNLENTPLSLSQMVAVSK